MKTNIIIAIMGLFMSLTNVSFAGGNKPLPECCQKQESCCAKKEKCCKDHNTSNKTSDCCAQQAECCKSNDACCETDGVKNNHKNPSRAKVSSKKVVSCHQESSCCK